MADTPEAAGPASVLNTPETTKRLAAPFDPDVLKEVNKQGTMLTYLPIGEAVARLNEVLGVGGWGYEIIRIGLSGQFDHVMSCHLRLRARIGGEWIVRDGVGGRVMGKLNKDKDGVEKWYMETDDAQKSAVSDALKKAAWTMGVGLYLSREGESYEPVSDADWRKFQGIVNGMADEAREEFRKWSQRVTGGAGLQSDTIDYDLLGECMDEIRRLKAAA